MGEIPRRQNVNRPVHVRRGAEIQAATEATTEPETPASTAAPEAEDVSVRPLGIFLRRAIASYPSL